MQKSQSYSSAPLTVGSNPGRAEVWLRKWRTSVAALPFWPNSGQNFTTGA